MVLRMIASLGQVCKLTVLLEGVVTEAISGKLSLIRNGRYFWKKCRLKEYFLCLKQDL